MAKKLLQLETTTGSTEAASATSVTALLNEFTGDSGSGGLKGLVKAPVAGDSIKTLNGDGTWKNPMSRVFAASLIFGG
jgi:hypothetical protein